MIKHYEHIKPTILAFFNEKELGVEIEPSGSRGPDVRGVGCALVGEVKHEKELIRDLHRAYWTNWNSPKQKFGGKKLDFLLAEHVPQGIDKISDMAKGWVAVICGQLRYMVIKAGLTKGWIVYENFTIFEDSLLEAVGFLRDNHVITADSPENRENVGFLLVEYLPEEGIGHRTECLYPFTLTALGKSKVKRSVG